MSQPTERTSLLKHASPEEEDSIVLHAAVELAEELHSPSSASSNKRHRSAIEVLAVSIRHALRIPDQILVLSYMLILPLFERPLWCFFERDCGERQDIPDSGIPRLPYYASLSIDLSVLLFFAFMSSLRIVSSGWTKVIGNPWRFAEFVCIVVGLLDTFMLFAIHREFLLWIPYIRPILFIIKYQHVQSVFHKLLLSGPQVLTILLLLAFNIFLFGWLGVLLFRKTDCDPHKRGNQGCSSSPDFDTLPHAWQTLYISLAFANILDVITDAKLAKPVWVLYVFAFVVTSIWILQSLVLAVIYNIYRQTEEAHKKDKDAHIKTLLRETFKKLDVRGVGYLETATIVKLFDAFNNLHITAHISRDQFDILYDLLDADNDDRVSLEEFFDLFDVLSMRVKKKRHPRKFFHDCLEFLYRSSAFQIFEAAMRSRIFEYCIDACVVLTAIVMFVQTFFMLENKYSKLFSDIDVTIAAFFVLQLFAKLIAYGPHEFWGRHYFRFELFITTLIVSAEIAQFASLSSTATSRNFVRWVMVLRVIGIVRLLAKLPTYRILFRAFSMLGKQTPSLALTFAVTLSIFSVIGMQSFGGTVRCIHETNDTIAEVLWRIKNGTPVSCDDESLKYLYALNFNDVYNSACTLFAVLTSNDWENLVQPILDRSSQWAQIYFYCFYISMNLAVLNLFIGFVIDSFLEKFKEQEQAEEDMSKWRARLKNPNQHHDQVIERIN